MTDEKIIEYVMDSSENTNPSVLDSMLKSNKVQPDWEQNDETAPDYVKNRPFYDGEMLVEYFASRTYHISGTNMVMANPPSRQIEVAAIYDVTIDGATTRYIGTEAEQDGSTVVYFGDNISDVKNGTIKGTYFIVENNVLYLMTSDDNLIGRRHTISIDEVVKKVEPIPKRYIPDMDSIILNSSTEGSTKKFKITVDDSSTLTTTAVTGWLRCKMDQLNRSAQSLE